MVNIGPLDATANITIPAAGTSPHWLDLLTGDVFTESLGLLKNLALPLGEGSLRVLLNVDQP